jgi:lipopolysaccharide/colanic/teichoic acid biosynthesis glycosyltransferase
LIAPRRRPLVTVTSEIREIRRAWHQRWAKRLIDVVGSLVILALVAPVFVAVVIAVRLSGPGPVFFVQHRCGLSGRLFRFYKFRTMIVDAEARKPALAHLNEISTRSTARPSRSRVTRGSRASDRCCASSASMSCRSCGTCSRGT